MRLEELAHGDLNVVAFKLLLRILAQFRGACNQWYATSSGGAEHAIHHACFASGKVVVGTAGTDHILEVSGVDITLKVNARHGLSGGFSGSTLERAECSLLQKHHATISAHLQGSRCAAFKSRQHINGYALGECNLIRLRVGIDLLGGKGHHAVRRNDWSR